MDNNKHEELNKLIQEKKYTEAVNLILGEPGSENDISRTNKFGVISMIGRNGLLKVFESGLSLNEVLSRADKINNATLKWNFKGNYNGDEPAYFNESDKSIAYLNTSFEDVKKPTILNEFPSVNNEAGKKLLEEVTFTYGEHIKDLNLKDVSLPLNDNSGTVNKEDFANMLKTLRGTPEQDNSKKNKPK